MERTQRTNISKATFFAFFLFIFSVDAKLSVVTTTPGLKSLVAEIGGEWVSVESYTKGTQDTHYIEAKPSFIPKTARADLVVAIGLDLESAWLGNVLQAARNAKVHLGTKGYLELGPKLEPLEIPKGTLDRSSGDVHGEGNPHFTLDPVRVGKAAMLIAERLGLLDPPHADIFSKNAREIEMRLGEKTKQWQSRIDRTGIKKAVTYHKTLNYFLSRFGIENVATLEPKPGIPPTSGHIIEVIRSVKQHGVSLILVENFFDPTVANRVKKEVASTRVELVPVDVEGSPQIKTFDDLYERLVSSVEGR